MGLTVTYYTQDANEALADLHTGKDGLSAKEAEARLAENGKNKLIEGKLVTKRPPLLMKSLSKRSVKGCHQLAV